MNKWHVNSTTDMSDKPPQHKDVMIELQDGTILKASWLKDVNKYVRNVNSWKIADTGSYIKDILVKAWRYENEVLEGIKSNNIDTDVQ